jgi:hypothetical protein
LRDTRPSCQTLTGCSAARIIGLLDIVGHLADAQRLGPVHAVTGGHELADQDRMPRGLARAVARGLAMTPPWGGSANTRPETAPAA